MKDIIIRKAIKKAIDATENAHTAISGKKVGACVIAADKYGSLEYFTGCNIELATSVVYHAERVALVKAISEGYPTIKMCVVTSTNEDQKAAMCGYCMQDFMYANPDCDIVVANMDGSMKFITTVKDRNGPNAYLGRGKLQLDR